MWLQKICFDVFCVGVFIVVPSSVVVGMCDVSFWVSSFKLTSFLPYEWMNHQSPSLSSILATRTVSERVKASIELGMLKESHLQLFCFLLVTTHPRDGYQPFFGFPVHPSLIVFVPFYLAIRVLTLLGLSLFAAFVVAWLFYFSLATLLLFVVSLKCTLVYHGL